MPERAERRSNPRTGRILSGFEVPAAAKRSVFALAPALLATGALVVVAAVGAVAWLAMLVAFGLPPPDGPYPVGTTTLTLARAAAANAPVGSFDVTLWYPSEPWNVRALFGSNGPGLKHFIYHHLVRTHAGSDAPFIANGGRFPVLLYVSGWGGDATVNTVLATDLASHGYVVAAIGDTDFDRPPLARLTGAADFSTAETLAATRRLAAAKIEYESGRALMVLQRLTALDRSDPNRRFTGRLQLDRVGMFGFSLGGAVALEACDLLARCGGAVDMDGYLWHLRKTHRFRYFLISSLATAEGVPTPRTMDELAVNTARMDAEDGVDQKSNLASGGYFLQIAGTNHYGFTDLPLFAPLQSFRSRIAPTHAARILDQFIVAFFDSCVKGRPAPLVDRGPERTPDFKLSEWPIGNAK